MKPEWRAILQHRSKLDKVGIAIEPDVTNAAMQSTADELVREGIIVWIDRAVLTHMIAATPDGKPMMRGGKLRHPTVDVYMLTAKGIELCDANGIKQR